MQKHLGVLVAVTSFVIAGFIADQQIGLFQGPLKGELMYPYFPTAQSSMPPASVSSMISSSVMYCGDGGVPFICEGKCGTPGWACARVGLTCVCKSPTDPGFPVPILPRLPPPPPPPKITFWTLDMSCKTTECSEVPEGDAMVRSHLKFSNKEMCGNSARMYCSAISSYSALIDGSVFTLHSCDGDMPVCEFGPKTSDQQEGFGFSTRKDCEDAFSRLCSNQNALK